MQLLPLMQLLKGPTHGTASIIPAALHQIATSPTYAFEITYETTDKAKPIIVPCQKVIALIRSHAKSTTESLGDGLKLTTQNVQCILHSGDEHPTGYTVTSVCTLSNLVAIGWTHREAAASAHWQRSQTRSGRPMWLKAYSY